jgi:hypothetical protein
MGTVTTELDFLDRTRRRTLALVAGLSQAQMDATPRAGKWSAGEQLDHLLLAERLYRGTIAELIALVKAGKRPFIERSVREINFSPNLIPKSVLPLFEVPFTVINLFMPAAMREMLIRYMLVPSQNPDIAIPAKGKPKAELTAGLADSFAQTRALIEANPGLPYHEMKLRHAVIGTNDVPFLVRLTALHEQRHQTQIEALLKALNLPVAA